MGSLLIKGGRIVSGGDGFDFTGDILIENGRIAAVDKELACAADEVFDAEGLAVMPGFVDMHVHLRDPGLTYKEDIFTGAAAAAAGGVTSVAAMPNTLPPIDCPDAVSDIYARADTADVHIYQIAAVTRAMAGRELTDFAALKNAGAVAFSDDGRPVESDELTAAAIKKAHELDMPIISHCEILSLTNGGLINEGEVSRALGVKGVPQKSEDDATLRDITLAERLSAAVHIAHVSTAVSCGSIREAKKRGVGVTCETAPHYFTLTEEALRGNPDANFRMSPPLRTEKDRQAVIEAICDGTIDAIVTDHAPHSEEDKADFYTAPNGIIGLQTSFSLSYTALVKAGYISLARLTELMSYDPARLLKINAGTLSVGAPADIAVADLNEEWRFTRDDVRSKSYNSPFFGYPLFGRIVKTYVGGREVYSK